MAKVNLDSILAGFKSVTKLISNFQSIEDEFNDKVLYRDNPSGEPNQMENELDMNSNRIINLPTATSPTEPATYGQITSITGLAQATNTSVENQIATAGQTVFTLGVYTYTPGLQNLSVYINGVRQLASTYTETSSTVVTFSAGAVAGDEYSFIINEYTADASSVQAANVTVTVDSVATNVAAQLKNYDSGVTNSVAHSLHSKLDDLITPSDVGASNEFYVATTGNDSNDGLTSGTPFATVQEAIDRWSLFAHNLKEDFTIHIAAGTYTEGAIADNIKSPFELILEGSGKATTIIDGTSSSLPMGLNFNGCGQVRIKNLTVQNWTGTGESGIIFQNGTRGVVDTCDATGNAEANFNCSEDSELVMIGVCSTSGASKFGIRVYRNSGASIGDGTNTITIDGATQSGILSRDGSMVVCNNGLVVENCSSTSTTSAIHAQKHGYIELRTCTIQNNSIGALVENLSSIDTQTGTRTFAGNTQNYRIVDRSTDRSQYVTSLDVAETWTPRSDPSGLTPTSNYDLIVDYNGATGLQFLTSGNDVNIDLDKKGRVSHVASDNSLRLAANNVDVIRLGGSPSANTSGMLLLVNDGSVTSLRTVKVGAADSGGSGQRLLTVDN